MPPRRAKDGKISEVYATIGPLASVALRYCEGDAVRAEELRAEWRRWHRKYGLDYANGRGVPPPPYHDTLGAGYAKPT